MITQTGLDPVALDVHLALLKLQRAYQFRDRDRVCCYDVSVTQSHALDRLRRLGPLTLNELAASLFIEKSTASRLVDGLEQKSYVSRRPHPDDGRTVQVWLTRPGERLAERIEADMVGQEEQILRDFTEHERRVIARAISDLAAAASSRISTDGGFCEWTELSSD